MVVIQENIPSKLNSRTWSYKNPIANYTQTPVTGPLPQHVVAHYPRSSLVEVGGPNKILESFPHAYTFDRLLVFRAQKDGVVPLGHKKSAQDNMIFLVPDLKENLGNWI